MLPYGEKQAEAAATKLDEWMPRSQFGERHTIEIAASPDKVFAAIHDVRADEIMLFRTLTAIRRCGQARPEDILNAPEQLVFTGVSSPPQRLHSPDVVARRGPPRRAPRSGRAMTVPDRDSGSPSALS